MTFAETGNSLFEIIFIFQQQTNIFLSFSASIAPLFMNSDKETVELTQTVKRTKQSSVDEETKRISTDETENELSQLKRFKSLLFSLTQTEEEKSEVTECFSSLKARDQNAFYQKGCKLLHSFLSIKKTFPNNEKLFVLCFLMKGISSSLSEKTNKSILTLLGSLLDDELKEKYAHEILKRAMKTRYSFSGEDGEEYSFLKPFWQEIKYSEETAPPQINNVIPVCLLCNDITNISLFAQ